MSNQNIPGLTIKYNDNLEMTTNVNTLVFSFADVETVVATSLDYASLSWTTSFPVSSLVLYGSTDGSSNDVEDWDAVTSSTYSNSFSEIITGASGPVYYRIVSTESDYIHTYSGKLWIGTTNNEEGGFSFTIEGTSTLGISAYVSVFTDSAGIDLKETFAPWIDNGNIPRVSSNTLEVNWHYYMLYDNYDTPLLAEYIPIQIVAGEIVDVVVPACTEWTIT